MRFGINSMTRGPLATRTAYMAVADVADRARLVTVRVECVQ